MYSRRRRGYFLLMGGCLLLFVSAWAFVRLWSVPAAIAMCFVAMVIPPVAAIVGNRRGPDDRWWDEPPPDSGSADRPTGKSTDRPTAKRTDKRSDLPPSGDRTSDEWWDELDGKKRRR
ncbi:DUF3099 domain-containing protein [Streptomyces sp. NBC_00440]|uniref:DUF3099 domain-containing protein n=1 Tax=unclassified Streptomyces TaxID=2593676 RepID=UPI002E1E971A|nr:DUF3099 domain-containing protein [Streptomyces sp. NBC_00932]